MHPTTASLLVLVPLVALSAAWYFSQMRKKSVKTVKIFDFDGTIFRSPVPSKKLWHPSLFKLLLEKSSTEPAVPLKPTEDWYFSPVVEEILKSMKDPESVTVLLTGRSYIYKEIIQNLVTHRGLVFDEYGLKPNQEMTTMKFKLDFISQMFSKYSPQRIEMWEDRPHHAEKFRKHLNEQGISHTVHTVTSYETFLEEAIEHQVVQHLIQQNLPTLQLKLFVNYVGVLLDEKSRQILLDEFKIPEGWGVYAHHVTVKLGSLEPKEFGYSVGDAVNFRGVAIGQSDRALALQVEGVNSTNAIPHVTLAVGPEGKPRDSNDITEWTPLAQPIQLFGVVKEFGTWGTETVKEKRSRGKKINLGGVVVQLLPNLPKSDIGKTVKAVKEWMKQQGLDNPDDNLEAITQHIKTLKLEAQ